MPGQPIPEDETFHEEVSRQQAEIDEARRKARRQ
jgi:hypothetical protein